MSSNKEMYLNFRDKIFEALDAEIIASLSKEALTTQIQGAVEVLATGYHRPVPSLMKSNLVKGFVDELTGLGPLQPLIEDQSVTDIMVNGPNHIYFERSGKLQRSEVTFVNEQQLLEIAKRIVAKIGRRVDESSPMVDARLEDAAGSILLSALSQLTVRQFQFVNSVTRKWALRN